jgi:hypothetical protein
MFCDEKLKTTENCAAARAPLSALPLCAKATGQFIWHLLG